MVQQSKHVDVCTEFQVCGCVAAAVVLFNSCTLEFELLTAATYSEQIQAKYSVEPYLLCKGALSAHPGAMVSVPSD